MEAPRQWQGAARGSQEGPGEAKQESQGLPGDAFGLPGDSLGAAWEGLRPALETPRHHFGVKVDPKLHCFAASFFEAVFCQFSS